MKVELFDDLAAAERAAAGSLDREVQASLFDRLSWFRLTLEHCPPPGRPLIILASEGGRQAWLFLTVEGRRAAALASWYTLRFDAIGDRALASAMGAALRQRGICRVELYPLLADSPLLGGFGSGWRSIAEPASASWRLRCEGLSFEDYWAARPSQLRNTVERKAKATALETVVHTSFEEGAWAAYEGVYRASWKPEEGSIAFLRALAEQEGAAGTLRLGIASYEGAPVAAQLWLVENGTATIHKLAYVEEARKLSAGTIVSMAMFRHVLDVDRVAMVDFGLGDERYKADWMSERAPVYRVTAFNMRSLDGLLGCARAAAAKLVHRRRSD